MVPMFLCVFLSLWWLCWCVWVCAPCVVSSAEGQRVPPFPLGEWDVHYALTAMMAGVSLLIQPKNKLWQSRLFACRCCPLLVILYFFPQKKKKHFSTCVWIFTLYTIPNRCLGWSESSRNLQPVGLCSATRCCQAWPRANKMHNHVMLYGIYSKVLGFDQIGQLGECC